MIASRHIQAGTSIGGVGVGAGATQALLFEDFAAGPSTFTVPDNFVLVLTYCITAAFGSPFTIEITPEANGRVLVFADGVGQTAFWPRITIPSGSVVSALIRNRGTAAAGSNSTHSLHGILLYRDDAEQARALTAYGPPFDDSSW